MQYFIIAALLVVSVFAQYQYQQQPNQQFNNQYQTTTRGYNQQYPYNSNQQQQQQYNSQFGTTNQFGQTTTPRYTSQYAYGTTQSGRQFDQQFNSVSKVSGLIAFVGAAAFALL